jgi:hypothetical protein
MIISQAKVEDMELRRDVLYCLELSLKYGHQELITSFGSFSKNLAEKIATHDYTEADKRIKKLNENPEL